jgi:hypothetical protein
MTEMAVHATEAPPVEASPRETKPKQKRERSAIAFPYEDLTTAVKLAEVVHHTYGGACSADQLAAALKASPSSGAFRLKVSAARLFGILGGSGPDITLTELGGQILEESDSGARSDAFLNVPLYRELYDFFQGKPLPSDAGLEAKVRELGVSTKQVTTARQVFVRSAEAAGFFAHGRGRLVMPPRTKVDRGPAADAGGTDDDGTDTGTSTPTIMKHPLIQGLLAVLPEPGEEFPAEERELWLKTLDMNLSFIYGRATKKPEPEAPTPPPSTLG